ncbi:hypothetical protein [Listeria fleischmannii]|uniref:hypothetical protein n=1 Tax=Listeria fleischmannii TaxID=1069827 RepID=UPI000254F9B8|nr:hypothetical protein [Listeria fleischmannii]EIA21388.1 hypothetical protein KKC_01322 [Listeria fleischmannii subsp. coloradonensis]STY35288.1 Uncharacterised protein [Listeria fleischmannii subsp. coloradonensis]
MKYHVEICPIYTFKISLYDAKTGKTSTVHDSLMVYPHDTLEDALSRELSKYDDVRGVYDFKLSEHDVSVWKFEVAGG